MISTIQSTFVVVLFALSIGGGVYAEDAPKPDKDSEVPVKRSEKATTTGMELFSWHVKGEDGWHFALLPAPGDDKLKTIDLVTTKDNAVDGIPALKKKLAALALNEKIGWFNMIDKKEPPSETVFFDFPAKDVVRDLELYCTTLKLRLNIYQAGAKK